MRSTPAHTPIPVNLVGSSTFGRYAKVSSSKTYNMYITRGGANAQGQQDEWLVNFAGYKKALTLLATGQGRGIFHSVRGNFMLAVVNSVVYRIEASLSVTTIGTLSSTRGEVVMDENLNNQICLVDGTYAYIYNHSLPPNLTRQTLTDPLVPNYVCYHNTFFLFGNGAITGNGAQWMAYSYDTDTTIVETTVLALQTKPDHAIAVVRLPGQANNVLVFGNAVCEIFTQVGGIQNYRRNSTINIDYGCISVETIACSDRYVVWLAANESNSPVIMIYSGESLERISTDGIDYLLSRVQFPSQSTAMFYRQDGHLFYQLTFYNSADNFTLAYDFTTQKFFNLSDKDLNCHPARKYVFFNENTYFISLTNASIYKSSTDITVYDEAISARDKSLVNEIPRIRICDSIRSSDSSRFIANSLVITLEQGCDEEVTTLSLNPNNIYLLDEDGEILITETGVPLLAEESGFYNSNGTNIPYVPRVDLSISNDGGITWSNTVGRYLNPVGYRKNMLTWEKLGQTNDLTLKFRFWGKGRFIVNNGQLQVYS